jgi:predicted Fe-Mo cluster-binding NifX family protein
MNEIVAIPCEAGVLANHFGHAPEFAFVEIENSSVKAVTMKKPPQHEPGILPRWVSENGATTVIAGGMGGKAIELFRQNNVNVVTGALNLEVEALATQFAEGKLTGGGNRCDH